MPDHAGGGTLRVRLGRAHSGRDRQLLNLLGYAITVNSLALHRHRRSAAPPGRLAA